MSAAKLATQVAVGRLTRRRLVALHEAGHIVAARALGMGVRAATIIPAGENLGCAYYTRRRTWEDEEAWTLDPYEWTRRRTRPTKDDLRLRHNGEAEIIVAFAGLVAESTLLGRRATGSQLRAAARDLRSARIVASHFADGPELEVYLRYLKVRAAEILGSVENRCLIYAVAEALLKRGTLGRRRLLQVLREADARFRTALRLSRLRARACA